MPRRAAAASSADWRSGSSTSLRSTHSDSPSIARFTRSRADRSNRSNHSSGRRTLRIHRSPWPMPTTLTTHCTRRSTAPVHTTVAPP